MTRSCTLAIRAFVAVWENELIDTQLSRYLMSPLACIRIYLLERELIKPDVSATALFDRYISADPRRSQDLGRQPFEVLAELVRDYKVPADVRSWWSWRRIRKELRTGPSRQAIVLVSGFYFKIPFPALRVWSWPWRAILVRHIEPRGPFMFVDLADPGRPSAHTEKQMPLFLFKRSRSAGLGSVLMWRYLWLKVPQFRERVPYPFMCLLIGP